VTECQIELISNSVREGYDMQHTVFGCDIEMCWGGGGGLREIKRRRLSTKSSLIFERKPAGGGLMTAFCLGLLLNSPWKKGFNIKMKGIFILSPPV
jgi:hypothetical protein